MKFVVIAFCLIISIIRLFIMKKYLDPGSYFFLFWAIILISVSLELFGLYSVTDFAYVVIFIGLLGYFIGDKLALSFTNKYKTKQIVTLKYKNKLNKRLLYFLYILTIIILLSNSINIIKLLKDGNSYLMIRTMYSNQGSTNLGDEYNQVLRSALNVVLVQFVSTPVVYASLPILFVNIFNGDNDKWILRFTSIMSLLWILTSGGRSIIIWSFIYYIFCYIYFKKSHYYQNKIKKVVSFKLIIISLIIIVLALFVTSSRRSNQDLNILRQIYIYFPVAIKNFDLHLHNIYNVSKTYGLSSFYGFIYPIVFFAHNLFGFNYPKILLDARFYSFTILEKDIFVGNGIWMNAYATIFYQPYLDGGMIGVFLLLCIFGFICKYLYLKIINNYNERSLVIYLYFMQKILFSHVRFYFTQTQQAIALIVLLLVYYNKRRSRMSNNV